MSGGPSKSKTAEIRAKIALLQKELNDEEARGGPQKREREWVRVSTTPSPKKRKIHEKSSRGAPTFPTSTGLPSAPERRVTPQTDSLARQRRETNLFQSTQSSATSLGRNEDLTVIEDLQPGPYHFNAPTTDPQFERFEPHSNINLRSRAIPHEVLQDYLRGRFFISPSMLYSIARLTKNRQGYEVPVAGDWVTIAVIVERGQISVSRGSNTGRDNDEECGSGKSQDDGERKVPKDSAAPKSQDDGMRKSAKKYLTLRLVDFGRRGQDPATGKSVIKGDALLNMILFEANTVSKIKDTEGLDRRVYRGGSGGAFEASSKFREGAVIAVLNPRILKPFQRGKDKPHPTDNVLALTPENEESITVIGTSQDLGKCPALKRDGTKCGSWCDKRISDVCDYHIQKAIQSRLASRPEFSSATNGISTGPSKGRKARMDFDPSRKWGLMPRAGVSSEGTKTSSSLGGGTTYILPGRVISFDSGAQKRNLVGSMDSSRRAKGQGLVDREQEAEIARLMEKDGGQSHGMKTLIQARKSSTQRENPAKMQPKTLAHNSVDVTATQQATVHPFSTSTIRRMGFDPSRTSECVKDNHHIRQALMALRQSTSEPALGSRPGPRTHSAVKAPTSSQTRPEVITKTNAAADSDSADELEIT